jgi:uncharacterized protein (TIGR02217 family)
MSTPSGLSKLIYQNAFQSAADGSLVFPILRGMSLEFTMKPTFSTIIQKATDRSTARIQLDPYPLWEYEIAFGYLTDDVEYAISNPITNQFALTDFQRLGGFFMACGGSAASFLLDTGAVTRRSSDSIAQGVLIGIGDGTSSVFQLVQRWGGFLELIENPIVKTLVISVNGVTTATTSCVNGLVTMAAPPANGAMIRASFNFLRRMRFQSDMESFESMSLNLYAKPKVKLIQERNVGQ